jgi:DNA-binding IclR family transcriptional regulator
VYVRCLAATDSRYQLRTFVQLGARVPLYCTGVGKLFLAFIADSERAEYVQGHALARRTANTITNADTLQEHLEIVRGQGYAIDNEEMEEGVKCIAAPVIDSGGVIAAAISVSGPSARLTEAKLLSLCPLILTCSRTISELLGFRP